MSAVETRPVAAARPDRVDRRVLLFLPEWDYGDPRRGPSSDRHFWLPAARAVARECEVLWSDRAWLDPGSLDERLRETVARVRPDLVMFFPFRDDVRPETLEAIKRDTTTLAFFSDDQWRFEDYSSRYATRYSYVVTTEPRALAPYRALGGHPILSQWAGRLIGEPRPPLDDEAAFRYDVSFVGGWNHYRGWLVRWLARRGVRVECFGALWPNGRVGYEEMEEIFRTSRLNLNVSNSRQLDVRYLLSGPRNLYNNLRTAKTAEQVKARHFEIAMAGGCQLSNYAVGLEDWLSIGDEIAVYASPEDCLHQIERLLADPERRHAMAQGAWRRSLAEHTYEQRVAAMFRAVWADGGGGR